MYFRAISWPKFQEFFLWCLPWGASQSHWTNQTLKELNLWGKTAVDKSAWIKAWKSHVVSCPSLNVMAKWENENRKIWNLHLNRYICYLSMYLYIYISISIHRYRYNIIYMTSFHRGYWINLFSNKWSHSQDLNDTIWLLKPQLKSLTKSFIGIWHIFLYDQIKQISAFQTVPYFSLLTCKLIILYVLHGWFPLTFLIREIAILF